MGNAQMPVSLSAEPRLVDVVIGKVMGLAGGPDLLAKARAEMIHSASEHDVKSAVAQQWGKQAFNAAISDLLQRANELLAPTIGHMPVRGLGAQDSSSPHIADIARRIFNRLRGVERY